MTEFKDAIEMMESHMNPDDVKVAREEAQHEILKEGAINSLIHEHSIRF